MKPMLKLQQRMVITMRKTAQRFGSIGAALLCPIPFSIITTSLDTLRRNGEDVIASLAIIVFFGTFIGLFLIAARRIVHHPVQSCLVLFVIGGVIAGSIFYSFIGAAVSHSIQPGFVGSDDFWVGGLLLVASLLMFLVGCLALISRWAGKAAVPSSFSEAPLNSRRHM